MQVNEVFYQEPVEDPAAWAECLGSAEKIFQTTTSRSVTLADTDPLYQSVATLVPWELVRVLLYRAPPQRRLPREFFFTHRGAALQYQDGHIEVEHEALDGMHFPKQRFRQGVSHAIFWYGYADPPQAKATTQPSAETSTSIKDAKDVEHPVKEASGPDIVAPSSKIAAVTFPGCPSDVPNEVRSAVTRLHLNLGHPTEKELLRLLAWQGAISKHMITAVKHLQCASCSRSKRAAQPRPSAMPVANLGQFNDNLQSDVFFCRDITGTNYAILGIIDQSTLLHQAERLSDRSSKCALEIFRRTWFRPYGFPLSIRVDPGTIYAKDFRDYVERHGIYLEVIPAESHWRIGLIERRNSVLRDILERVIDAESVMNPEDFDQALECSVHAIN